MGVEEEGLERYVEAFGKVSQVYVESLGRFPDVGALLSRSPRIAFETLRTSGMLECVPGVCGVVEAVY